MAEHGRSALVTGGGRGIGAAIASALAAAGHRVIITGRGADDLQRHAAQLTARGAEAFAVPGDVTLAVDVERIVQEARARFGAVDVLVNNAGMAKSAPLRATDDGFWDAHVALNLTAAFRLCRAVAPDMAARGWGRVVNVASVAGRTGFPYTTAYSASKAGLLGLTRALAAELGGKGVTVNAVCPGWVDTDLGAAAVANVAQKTGQSAERAKARLAEVSPLKRFMTPDEIAAVVGFLASDAAGAVNGQSWNVDGGELMS